MRRRSNCEMRRLWLRRRMCRRRWRGGLRHGVVCEHEVDGMGEACQRCIAIDGMLTATIFRDFGGGARNQAASRAVPVRGRDTAMRSWGAYVSNGAVRRIVTGFDQFSKYRQSVLALRGGGFTVFMYACVPTRLQPRTPVIFAPFCFSFCFCFFVWPEFVWMRVRERRRVYRFVWSVCHG